MTMYEHVSVHVYRSICDCVGFHGLLYASKNIYMCLRNYFSKNSSRSKRSFLTLPRHIFVQLWFVDDSLNNSTDLSTFLIISNLITKISY